MLYVDATMLTEHGYVPAMVTEGEPGYSPMTGNGAGAAPWYWGHDLARAQALAAEANARMGIDPDTALRIVLSSMAAQQRAGR